MNATDSLMVAVHSEELQRNNLLCGNFLDINPIRDQKQKRSVYLPHIEYYQESFGIFVVSDTPT
jgi:hypothetical protein